MFIFQSRLACSLRMACEFLASESPEKFGQIKIPRIHYQIYWFKISDIWGLVICILKIKPGYFYAHLKLRQLTCNLNLFPRFTSVPLPPPFTVSVILQVGTGTTTG